MQIPGYLEAKDELKAHGVDEVIVFCVNDGAVMSAWAKDQGVPEGGLITFMGDPWSNLVSALDIELVADGPRNEKGLLKRGKRTAIYAEDGVAKIVRIAEAEDDPAGDDHPDITLAGAMMKHIEELHPFMGKMGSEL